MGLGLKLFILTFLLSMAFSESRGPGTIKKLFKGPFDESDYHMFRVLKPATISNSALQVTPDSAGNYPLFNQSGRIMFKDSFKLHDKGARVASFNTSSFKLHDKGARVASFNTSFFININNLSSSTSGHGEGMAFVIAPDLNLPPGSEGQYLGLTNASTDGNATNHLVAIEFDTFKEDFDPDNNHIGLNINSVLSKQNVSLSDFGIQLMPEGAKNFTIWIQYDGVNKTLEVFMVAEDSTVPAKSRPNNPVMIAKDLDIAEIVNEHSYFGFAASTGEAAELHCVLGWNLTVEKLLEDEGLVIEAKIALGAGMPLLVILLAGCWLHLILSKKREKANDPKILVTLKCLPGAPREFQFRELKAATDNFNEKNKLGQGGFGVVYKGVLSKESLEIAVKRFSRDNVKSKDDFLAELTIINRLRHKHLVKLLGWCYQKGKLLLVYEYMPNGSLDAHIFCGPEKATIRWDIRYQIISGVASALHYVHNEYDQKVVHRDLKASNIMLDSSFNARLGDFGLARAIENGKTSYAEIEGVPGTLGYIAPECLHTGKATRESDIYGFGAVVLEVVCGQRPWTKIGEFSFLVDWVWSLHREGRILEAVDERLRGDYVAEEAERLLLLGLACSHLNASERPKTQAILQIASGSQPVPYVPPSRPAFVWPSAGAVEVNIDSEYTDDLTVSILP
ncbi:probable L-type lectin-domain containing receptor kinase S.5 [Rhodamnia argentea]|uniref:Probable L-type lectin-domain containing receptor kinase S.5 n=1 Tax=Rhodamnia argentea TaxID=178133 RepID=A0A8B8PM70_9MYRT|nr:probable L-type lectin-domain containing receptor kinase S.5 [Rhodamnia argentea]